MFMSGSEWGFIFGLGITQVFDGIGMSLAEQHGAVPKYIAFALNCVIAVVYIVLGIFSSRRVTPVFIVGLVLYALDGLLCLLVGAWLNVAFHAFAGFYIFRGMQAGVQLNKMAIEPQPSLANTGQTLG
jgi:hypothetical protein